LGPAGHSHYVNKSPQPSGIDPDEAFMSISMIEAHPVTVVQIASLVIENSIRQGGENPDHIRLLAEAADNLPPIIVHRSTMRIIDGVHRVRAALLNGNNKIRARLLDCDERVAFVLAVKANVAHGLPLSQSDRALAAARVIRSHPQWSDRAVAVATGLSDKTVSRIRDRSSSETTQSDSRRGQDGRVRPLNSGPMRQQAAAMINGNREVALREVARATGLSVATVRDVRQRIDRGENPVPEKYQAQSSKGSGVTPSPPRPPRPRQRPWRAGTSAERQALLTKLRHDPALKFSEAGRDAVRWLHHHTGDAEELESLGQGLPDHWAPVIASLARDCAKAWSGLAEKLEQRTG
jgi:ParB-like chromosome segregation protein Spo0J